MRSPRSFSRRRVAGAFALVAAMLVCTASASAADTWAAGKGLITPGARFMLGATTGADGTVYVVGGINGAGDLANAQAYGPSATAWSNLPSMHYYRSSAGVATGGDGRIYAFGGNGGLASDPNGDTGSLLSTSEAYNPSTGTWQQNIPALPTPRAGMATVGDTGPTGNGDLYVIGGWDGVGDGFLSTNLRYDPSAGTWSTMAPMPTPREYASAVLGSDGDIYVIGGMNDNGSLSTVEIYDPVADKWTTGPSLPTAEWGGSAAVVKNRIFVFGGYDDTDSTALTSNQVFTIGGSSWSTDTDVPRLRYLGAAAVTASLKVWVMGGIGATGSLAANDVFTSVDGTPPTGTVSIDAGQASTNSFNVTLSTTATDNTGGSGVANILISNRSTLDNGILAAGDEMPYTANESIPWDLSNTAYGGTQSQGTRWVYVQWEDNAGNWSPIHSDSITVDTVAPLITRDPTLRLLPNTVLGAGVFPVNVFWSGSDNETSPTYALKQSCNAGTTWTAVPLSPTTATSVTRSLSRGVNCEFEVQARDAVGNLSPETPSRTFHGSVAQESAPTITRTGTWSIANSSSFDGGHDRYSTKANSTMSYTFTGTGVALVSPTGPTRGAARVYLDGKLDKAVSEYTKAPAFRHLVYTHMWAVSGTHTLKIVVVGTSGRPRIDVDAFLVLS